MARQALGTLAEALAMEKTRIVRDASIQRFEYTFEAMWKAAGRAFVKQHEGVMPPLPRRLSAPASRMRVTAGTLVGWSLPAIQFRDLRRTQRAGHPPSLGLRRLAGREMRYASRQKILLGMNLSPRGFRF